MRRPENSRVTDDGKSRENSTGGKPNPLPLCSGLTLPNVKLGLRGCSHLVERLQFCYSTVKAELMSAQWRATDSLDIWKKRCSTAQVKGRNQRELKLESMSILLQPIRPTGYVANCNDCSFPCTLAPRSTPTRLCPALDEKALLFRSEHLPRTCSKWGFLAPSHNCWMRSRILSKLGWGLPVRKP